MTKWKPKNKWFSDIYCRVYSNLPLDYRVVFNAEWDSLESRIRKYYKLRAKR